MRLFLTVMVSMIALACGGASDETRTTTPRADRTSHDATYDNDRDGRDVDGDGDGDVDIDEGDGDDDGRVTAQDQGNDEDDLAITQHIRESVVADDALSLAAKNVVIVTEDGVVTLTGASVTAAERSALEAHASSCEGVRSVRNELETDG